jgi:methionine aminotransferase
MNTVPSKLPNVGTTIFSVMSALARKHNAVNLSQGFPDFNPDERLLLAAEKAIRSNLNQYALMAGNISLREKLAQKYASLYDASIHPEEEITITAGGTQAIFTAIQAVVNKGDEVLMFAPCYDSYAPAVELAAGKCVYYNLQPPTFEIDWNEVAQLINEKTRLIILNAPHNPTGTCWSKTDMFQLEKLMEGKNILLLSDEVYEHIVFDKQPQESILRYPKLRERAFVISSFGKTYHCTGWKVGYCIAPKSLSAEFRKVHQFNVFSVNSIAQAAFDAVLDYPELYLSLSGFYEAKRNHFTSLLQHTKFKLLPCAGTYFQLVDYRAISNLPEVEFAKWLTTEIGVAAIPVSVFYPDSALENSLVRFCFAKENSTLEAAAERLVRI